VDTRIHHDLSASTEPLHGSQHVDSLSLITTTFLTSYGPQDPTYESQQVVADWRASKVEEPKAVSEALHPSWSEAQGCQTAGKSAILFLLFFFEVRLISVELQRHHAGNRTL